MLKRIRHLLVKEFIQLFRDPRSRMMVFAVPVLQMTVFAFALTTDVNHIRTAVLDADSSHESREIVAAFSSSGYFEITEYLDNQREIAGQLDASRAQVVLNIPRGFGEDILSGRTASLQILADGTDSNSVSIVFNYAGRIVSAYSSQILQDRTESAGLSGILPRIEIRTRAWFNPNTESKYSYVPGLIAVMVLVISMLLTGVAIVREKEIGTIEQVMVTPLTSFEFILGKTIPYAIIGYIVLTMMLIVAWLVFGMQVAGSLPLLYGLTGIFILGNLGIALAISGTAQTQQQAVLTSFLVMMPCVLLSGFMFPVANMPEVVQWATWANPLRWYLEILRAVVLKGVGMEALWLQSGMMALLAAIFITIAARSVRKTAA